MNLLIKVMHSILQFNANVLSLFTPTTVQSEVTAFFLVFWNVQEADTVVLLVSMMIYGKLWSLLCHHLPDQVSMKASPNGRRV
ncbi:hypothetical protein T10_7121, partial [Trichinella papuae]